RQETHRRAHGQQHEDVDGNFRDREIDAHPSVSIRVPSANATVAGILRRKAKLFLRRQGGEVKPRRDAETKNISIS
ncbi:MAG: hypothetical protein ABJB10_15225, partial [Mesorhizobium sp.]